MLSIFGLVGLAVAEYHKNKKILIFSAYLTTFWITLANFIATLVNILGITSVTIFFSYHFVFEYISLSGGIFKWLRDLAMNKAPTRGDLGTSLLILFGMIYLVIFIPFSLVLYGQYKMNPKFKLAILELGNDENDGDAVEDELEAEMVVVQ